MILSSFFITSRSNVVCLLLLLFCFIIVNGMLITMIYQTNTYRFLLAFIFVIQIANENSFNWK